MEYFAPVVKLAYTIDLGSISARSAGSSPVRRTNKSRAASAALLLFVHLIGIAESHRKSIDWP